MSLTLEPDYFISSNGLPKLNSKKYLKTYDRKSYRSKVENREQVSCEKTVSGEQEKRLFSGSGIVMDTKSYCDNKKLLSRRSNMETTRILFNSNKNIDYFHRCGGKQSTNKISDKDLKCAINQKIKLCRNNLKSLQHREEISSNNSSNGMLDNRLIITTTSATPYQQKYFNEIISDHETDTLVLDF